jgi:hypothetical protein
MPRNFEGEEVPARQVKAFRDVVFGICEESIERGVKEWNRVLLKITEDRKSRYDKQTGKRTFFYSWCGDWVTYHLWQAGCLHRCLNRLSVHGKWHPGKNLSLLRAWGGDEATGRSSPKYVRAMFQGDESAGNSWHEWDNKQDRCADGYAPRLADLLVTPRKNGDHIEFWISRKDKSITVCAGAQVGGVAKLRTRDLDMQKVLGVIDVSRLAPSNPF